MRFLMTLMNKLVKEIQDYKGLLQNASENTRENIKETIKCKEKMLAFIYSIRPRALQTNLAALNAPKCQHKNACLSKRSKKKREKAYHFM